MRFLADERLYADSDYCLAWLQSQRPAARPALERWRAHLYWRGTIGRKQALAIASFLAAHPADVADLWLWLDAEDGYERHAASPILSRLLPMLTVKRFDPDVETRGTPLEDAPALWSGLPAVRRSNLVRAAVLFKYGGVYADMDMVFLRDLSPLFPAHGEAFCYRWSADQPYGNSAVMAVARESALARAFLERCRRRGSCRPRDVLRFDDAPDLDLVVLPCPLFDPLWPVRDGQDRTSRPPFRQFHDFFRRFGWRVPRPASPATVETFFPGAFTYHWHNGWGREEHDDSFFGQLERDVARRLEPALAPATRP
jgi:hypothetical protein